MLFVFIYAYRCPRRFSYQMGLLRLIVLRRMSLEEQQLLTLSEHLSSSPLFNGVRVANNLQFFVQYFRNSLFVLQYFPLWSLYCLFFFELRLVITPLVSCCNCIVLIRMEIELHYKAIKIQSLLFCNQICISGTSWP